MYIISYSEHSDTIQILHKERQISTQVVVSKRAKFLGDAKLLQQQEVPRK